MQISLLELPSAISSNFHKFHSLYQISSLSVVILALERARSQREPNQDCMAVKQPGDVMFGQEVLYQMQWICECIVMTKVPVTTWPQLLPFSPHSILQPAKAFCIVLCLGGAYSWQIRSTLSSKTLNTDSMLLPDRGSSYMDSQPLKV